MYISLCCVLFVHWLNKYLSNSYLCVLCTASRHQGCGSKTDKISFTFNGEVLWKQVPFKITLDSSMWYKGNNGGLKNGEKLVGESQTWWWEKALSAGGRWLNIGLWNRSCHHPVSQGKLLAQGCTGHDSSQADPFPLITVLEFVDLNYQSCFPWKYFLWTQSFFALKTDSPLSPDLLLSSFTCLGPFALGLPLGHFIVNQHFCLRTAVEKRRVAKWKWITCLFIKNIGLLRDKVETIALNGF